MYEWTQRKIFWWKFVTRLFWGTIDFHSRRKSTMEVNGASELLCFPHSSKYLPLCSAYIYIYIYKKKKNLSDNYTAGTLSHLQLHKHLHCPLFYDWADAVQIFTEAADCRTQHINLRVGPFGSERSSVQKERVCYNISTILKQQQYIWNTAEDVVSAEERKS